MKPESRAKYSAEDDNVTLSFDELVRRSEEAKALYIQEYHIIASGGLPSETQSGEGSARHAEMGG